MSGPPAPDDSQDLARAGYRQELDRSLGSFSAFAAGFSYLSILTGIFQNFHLGYKEGGPAFFWTWPLMFLGQLTVALCFAELAAHYPLCGGVYPWARRVGSPFVGWMAGWVYLASLVVTLAAVALALQVTLPQIWPAANLFHKADGSADTARNAVVLGSLLIVFSTIVNSLGVRWLARINNLGVFAELFGVVLLIILLAVHVQRGPGVLLDTQGRGAGQTGGYFGAFCAAAVMASYVMYGYDTAGTLAEETAEPRRRAPRAILQALTAAAVGGGLLLVFALLSAGNLTDPRLSSVEGGLPSLVKDVLGPDLGTIFLADVVFAISVCVLAVHTGAARLLFAMARDGSIPFSRRLAHVSPRTRTPTMPVLIAGAAALLLLLVNIDFEEVLSALVAVSIVWANLAYLLVTLPLLVRRLQGWPGNDKYGMSRLFALGKWGIAVNVVAVLWGTLTAVNMAWPRESVYGEGAGQRYAGLLYTGVLLLVGVVYYGTMRRGKDGIGLGEPGASATGVHLGEPGASATGVHLGEPGASATGVHLGEPGASATGVHLGEPGASATGVHLGEPGASATGVHLGEPGASATGVHLGEPGASATGVHLGEPGASATGVHLGEPGASATGVHLGEPGASATGGLPPVADAPGSPRQRKDDP